MSPNRLTCSLHFAVWKKYFGRKKEGHTTSSLPSKEEENGVPFNWFSPETERCWKRVEQIEKLCRISQPGKDREKWQICVARYSGTDGLKYCFKPAEPTFFLYPPGIAQKRSGSIYRVVTYWYVCLRDLVCNGEKKGKKVGNDIAGMRQREKERKRGRMKL